MQLKQVDPQIVFLTNDQSYTCRGVWSYLAIDSNIISKKKGTKNILSFLFILVAENSLWSVITCNGCLQTCGIEEFDFYERFILAWCLTSILVL